MRIRRALTARLTLAMVVLTLVAFPLSGQSAAQSSWTVEKTFHIGGEGGMDYVTVDEKNHLLYVPRSTHTMVIDAESGKVVADIPGQKHNHGVALVPEAGRGFISDGSGAVVIFDLKTNAVLGTITAQPDADGIIFDKASGLVLVVSGDNGVLMTLKPDVDPKTGTIDAPIELGGKPEFLASDGAGKVYINLLLTRLVKPEIYLHGNHDVDCFPVFGGRLKPPFSYRLNRLFIQAETQGIRDDNVVSEAIWSYHNCQSDRALIFRFPRFFGKLRVGSIDQFRGRDAVTHSEYAAAGAAASSLTKSRTTAYADATT